MYIIYNVLNGETLESIANKFGTDVETLKKLNDINGVTPGMQVIVPREKTDEYLTTYIVKRGDNLYEISKRYDVSVDALREINGLSKDEYLYPNQELIVPKEGIELYIVKEGDTLKDVSGKMGTNIETLSKNNEKIFLMPEQLLVYKK